MAHEACCAAEADGGGGGGGEGRGARNGVVSINTPAYLAFLSTSLMFASERSRMRDHNRIGWGKGRDFLNIRPFFCYGKVLILQTKKDTMQKKLITSDLLLQRQFGTTAGYRQITRGVHQSPLLQVSQALLHANLNHLSQHFLCLLRLIVTINVRDYIAHNVL